MLTREQIIAAAKPRTKEVEVPAWGGSVFIREFTVADASSFAGRSTEDRSVTTRLIAMAVCDADGSLLLSEEEVGAFAAKRGSEAINALASAILDFNGMSAAAAEEAAKN